MWHKSLFISSFTIALLTGCNNPNLEEITSEPVRAEITNPSIKKQLYKKYNLTVRTFIAGDSQDDKKEVTGLSCKVGSEYLSANIKTPAEITVPAFLQAERFEERGNPGAMKISCKGSQYAGEKTIHAYPLGYVAPSSSVQTTTYSNGQTVTSGYQTMAMSGMTRSTKPWIYPQIIEVIVD